MAGMGKRMRPHTLTIPKPLIKIAGKPIVQRLVEEIVSVSKQEVDEIAYVVGDFGKEIEDNLIHIAETLGAKGSIYYQKEALGTAHAVLCAQDSMEGHTIVAFADTLFKANFELNPDQEGIIWTKKVEDPSAFGVVKKNDKGIITDFIEKPQTFVSDEAIIGIYYFKDGAYLKSELQYLIDNDVIKGGEYQLTDALENMKQKGLDFTTGQVTEWLDCGNKDATVYTNKRILVNHAEEKLIADSVKKSNAIIIPPCYLGEDVELENCIIGPHVSVGAHTRIKNSIITNSIIQNHSLIRNSTLDNSMIGSDVDYRGTIRSVSIGDFTKFT